MSRVYLSPPDAGPAEREALLRAFDSGWIAPVGPEIDAFETELAEASGRRHAVALTSATAAMHLALLELGDLSGREVVVPTLTFVATANVVRYVNAIPVFVDSELDSWNLDPDLLEELLKTRAARGDLPAAVFSVDLYGNCADYDRISALCAEYEVVLIEDAAEGLGASFAGRPAGSFGHAAVFSFNGNKIITTSGGGALLTDDEVAAQRARHLATQAREPVMHYEHVDLGFNYRISNLLAALGRAQLTTLADRVARRTAVEARYRQALIDLPGCSFIPRPAAGRANCWLTCVMIDPTAAGTDRDRVIEALARADIEARPTWKPMHQQPLFLGTTSLLTGVADGIFEQGLCLPTGSNLASADQARVIAVVKDAFPS